MGGCQDAVRFLGTAGFFDKVVEFSDEPAEDVAAWIDAEMNARLANLKFQAAVLYRHCW